MLRDLGRCDEAIAHGLRAVQLNPLSAVSIHDHGYSYYYCRRFEEAAQMLQRAVQMDPNLAIAQLRLGMSYEQLGRFPEAIAAAARAVEVTDRRPLLLAGLGRIYASAGQPQRARQILDELLGRSDEYVDGVYMAALFTGLGDHDRALTELERAFAERSPSLVSLKVHPWHDPLRSQPRFRRLLQRMRLTDS